MPLTFILSPGGGEDEGEGDFRTNEDASSRQIGSPYLPFF